jgi:hypothetical protein
MDHRVTPHEMIRVSFMITGDVPADVVRFTALAPSGDYKQFSTRGNFTKTVMISDRELEADEHDGETETVRPLPPGVDCALTYVHFVDGSDWSGDSP